MVTGMTAMPPFVSIVIPAFLQYPENFSADIVMELKVKI
jgi:hypothetical protein